MRKRFIAVAALAAATLISPPPARAASWQPVAAVSHPMGLAIDLRGKPTANKWAYTLDYYANRVVKFGTGGKQLGSWPYSPETLYKLGGGTAVGGAGNVFVADGTGGRVLKFDPYGKRLAQFGPFQLPRAVAVDGAGNVYVAEQRGLRVTKLSPGGTVLARWNLPWANGAESSAPFAIALDRQGNVFVAVSCQAESCRDDHGDAQRAVLKLNSSGVMQSSLVGGTPHGGWSKGEEPWVVLDSIAVDPLGNLHVAGLLGGTANTLSYGVLVYASGSHRTARYTLPGWGAVPGLAVDGKGTIYVAQGDRVLSLRR
jgi:DNA-binding beta-propeller fold protein YncE